jgi:hypothetical protein
MTNSEEDAASHVSSLYKLSYEEDVKRPIDPSLSSSSPAPGSSASNRADSSSQICYINPTFGHICSMVSLEEIEKTNTPMMLTALSNNHAK